MPPPAFEEAGVARPDAAGAVELSVPAEPEGAVDAAGPEPVGRGEPVGVGNVGSGRDGSGFDGIGSVGNGSVGSGSVGNGSVGSGSVGSGSVGSGSVGSGSDGNANDGTSSDGSVTGRLGNGPAPATGVLTSAITSRLPAA